MDLAGVPRDERGDPGGLVRGRGPRLGPPVVCETSTRRRSRISCVDVEKITTRRREDGGVVVEKNIKSRRTLNKNSCDLVTAITHTKILVAYFIISDKKTEVQVVDDLITALVHVEN